MSVSSEQGGTTLVGGLTPPARFNPNVRFTQALIQSSPFSESATALWSGRSISLEGIVGSSSALAAAALVQQGNSSMVIVMPNAGDAEQIAEDTALFLMPEYQKNVLLFPPIKQRNYEPETDLPITDEAFGERLGVLKRLQNRVEERFIVVVSMPALQQPVPPPELLLERTQTLSVNSRVDLESLRRFLVEGGYHSTSAVDLPGEFAVRGYIFDLFAPDWEHPVRIEFFNDEIESIRRFDLTTQRSLESITEFDLTRLQPHECIGASLLNYVPQSVPIVLIEPGAFAES